MVLNKQSQGPYKSYKLNKVDKNPLSSHFPPKKYRKLGKSLTITDVHNNYLIEDNEERKKLEEQVNDLFGTEAQPILESVDFAV